MGYKPPTLSSSYSVDFRMCYQLKIIDTSLFHFFHFVYKIITKCVTNLKIGEDVTKLV